MDLFAIKRGPKQGLLGKITDGLAPRLSHVRNFLHKAPSSWTEEDLAGHREAQRLAYQCATDIAAQIRVGLSEKRVAALMDTYLQDCGVKTFFHRSFAWFGERSAFEGFKSYFDFLPQDRELKEGEVVILDVAPIVKGYTADIGYTFSLTPNPQLEKAQAFLLSLRQSIPKLFLSAQNVAQIYSEVDLAITRQGYQNRHSFYPGEVLGHRVHKCTLPFAPGLLRPFSLQAYLDLFSRGLFPELLGPHHQGDRRGLWAIEPHLGCQGFGAKFEEILVVTGERAYWLDEEVPHLAKKSTGGVRE